MGESPDGTDGTDNNRRRLQDVKASANASGLSAREHRIQTTLVLAQCGAVDRIDSFVTSDPVLSSAMQRVPRSSRTDESTRGRHIGRCGHRWRSDTVES